MTWLHELAQQFPESRRIAASHVLLGLTLGIIVLRPPYGEPCEEAYDWSYQGQFSWFELCQPLGRQGVADRRSALP